jgi:hypothetical protein
VAKNFEKWILGGLHEKHAVQRGIWVPTQHLLWDQGKPSSSWPVAGPSGCKLTPSQQSGVEYASPNIVSLSVRLLYYKIRTQFALQMFYIHIIWISNIPYTTLKKMMDTVPNMNTCSRNRSCSPLFSFCTNRTGNIASSSFSVLCLADAQKAPSLCCSLCGGG